MSSAFLDDPVFTSLYFKTRSFLTSTWHGYADGDCSTELKFKLVFQL